MKKVLFLVVSLFVNNLAMANTNDVVKDTNGHIVKNTFGNCVRTNWVVEMDACGASSVRPVLSLDEPISRRPIKRSRSYLVFFDFDKYNLSPDAVSIIKKAKEEALQTQGAVNFTITGHTDLAGSDAYNMKLSSSRANSVKQELVKLGVESSGVATFAKGEKEPLVATPDGVKEPQNRRVEIIYSIEE